MSDMSNAEVALLERNNGMFSGDSAFFWIFALLILAGGGFGGFFGGDRGGYVTQADLTAGLNNNATQAQLQQIALSSANNNYETARLLDAQTNRIEQQNNTNLVNAIQGFNQIGQLIQNQTNVLQGQLMALGAQMNECCCSIKTQMLQDRLSDRDTQLAAARAEISNNIQSQYILSQMGRFVPWAGSGATATTGT